MERFASNSEDFTVKINLFCRNALVIYLIPRCGIKWGHLVQGFLEFDDVYLWTIGEDILYFLGFGIEKSLDQEGIGPTLDQGLEQTETPCNDLFACAIVVSQ